MESELRVTSVKRKNKHENMKLRSCTNEDNDEIQIFDTNKIKKINNAQLSSLSKSVSKSMDVIVDIHRECKEEHIENIGYNEISNKRSFNTCTNNIKTFFKTNAFRDKIKKNSNINRVKRENLGEEQDDIKIVDSLDLIEEFHEPSINKKDKQNFKTMEENTLSKENVNRSFDEELYSRKQWVTIRNSVEEPKKQPRKRWSKGTGQIQLPETKAIFWNRTKRSLPAIGHSSIQKSNSAYDNEAFLSENEEILRIETNFNPENTKIEMKSIVDKVNDYEIPGVGNRSSQGSSSDKEISEEASIVTESLNESTKSAITDTKHFSNFEHVFSIGRTNHESTSYSESRKDVSAYSDSSQSSEEITERSDLSFEELSLKDDQLWNKEKDKRDDEQRAMVPTESNELKKDNLACFNHFDKNNLKNSGELTTSTTEDDYLDGDRSEAANCENKLRSNMKSTKLKYTEDHSSKQCRKDKKKSLRKNASGSSRHTPFVYADQDSKKKKKKKIDIKYISITVHRTDMLEIDYITKHPMVKVHIVNADNGKYLKCKYGATKFLQSMITRKFDFKENKSVVPVWEEELIFEHDFNALLKTGNEQVVILFEVVDLLSFAEASFNYDKYGHEGCWYKVAWAFLKPTGRHNVLHINKMVRLQLYKPRRNLRKFENFHSCEVYTWWRSNIRERYPSSLFVTVTSIDSPKLEPVFYQQLSLHNLSKGSNESQKISVRASELIKLPKWTRLAAQSCKIPNEIIFETVTSENGCFYIAFSNNGKYLACSFSEESDYPIIVYEVETKRIHVRFAGHKTFVYSINWSNNDKCILSVSSDQTARVWDVQNQIVQYIEMMPHPSYVYCGRFCPENPSIVATGCYDQIARIWIQDKKLKNRDLSQELEGHEGFINSMCFQKNSNLLTADSVGIIIIWAIKKDRRVLSRKQWHISQKIRVRDIDGVIINTIVLHPLESRLLVHSRNNGLRMLDLATGVVLQKYNELNNQSIQSTACISPCGGLIFCGGEDSSINVWHLETGILVARYTFDRSFRAVTCIDYHPYDHVLAFSTFGSSSPVRILRFNKNANGDDVGLKIFKETERDIIDNNNITTKYLDTSVKCRERSQVKDKEQILENSSKERSLLSSQSYNSSLFKTADDVLSEKDDKDRNARIKLQRLNEAGQVLKSKSASRLYSIIEKIDRILSNTSRSPGDVESGWNLALIQETSTNKTKTVTNLNENVEKAKTQLGRKKLVYLNNENQSDSNVELSVTNSDKQEVIELRTVENTVSTDWATQKRSKTVKEIKINDVPKHDALRTFPESATNYQKTKIHCGIGKTRSHKHIEFGIPVNTDRHNSEPIVFRKNNRFRDGQSNSSDSSEIYNVEKNDARNSDRELIKISEEKDSILSETENKSNSVKCSDSESSVLSNATFIIENEIPIPKPRKEIDLK